MATHASFEAGLVTDLQNNVLAPPNEARSARVESSVERADISQRKSASPEAAGTRAARRGRRSITREHGRALEMIGHAVDYLNDCFLNEGADDEIINAARPYTEALQILISAHSELLWSLPVSETVTTRLLNFMFRRKPRLESGPVVT